MLSIMRFPWLPSVEGTGVTELLGLAIRQTWLAHSCMRARSLGCCLRSVAIRVWLPFRVEYVVAESNLPRALTLPWKEGTENSDFDKGVTLAVPEELGSQAAKIR